MYLIVTRSFPPELGGMQSLMWGLARELSKNFMIKVFADYVEKHKEFDEQATFSIERVGGPKLLRKYRKAYLIDEFIKNGKVNGIIADHWKSLEHLKTNNKKYCLIHGKEINHAKGSGINKRLLKVLNNVEKVIANSKYTKNLAIEIGVKEENIIVINPGIDPIKDLDQKSLDKVDAVLSNIFLTLLLPWFRFRFQVSWADYSFGPPNVQACGCNEEQDFSSCEYLKCRHFHSFLG